MNRLNPLNSLSRCKIVGLALLLVNVGVGAATRAPAAAPALPRYQVDLSQTTVSGLSSGAFMASQFAVAYSGIVRGVGIIAGGPFYCSGAPGVAPFIPYLVNALSECMNPSAAGVEPPDAMVLWQRAGEFAKAGLIDDVDNLKRQQVYLFSGSNDATVTAPVVDQVFSFYQLAGAPAASLMLVDNVASGHGMVTDNPADGPCTATQPPFFNNCGLKQAQQVLQHLYGPLKAPAPKLSGKIIRFNQRAFTEPLAAMSESAYAYVPAACTSSSCRVHVAFHGCRQGVAAIGDHFYARAGYNEVADSNNIIVLYPQLEPSFLYPYNPKGCWDFWGYTSVDPLTPTFYTRNGPQMLAVHKMLQRLAQTRQIVAAHTKH